MNIFFDVDETIISWNERLRPHVREVFAALVADGHVLYLWSGRGERPAVVREHALGAWVRSAHAKPLYDHRARLGELGVPCLPEFVVDDDAGPVQVFGGVQVRPAVPPFAGDGEMLRVLAAVRARAEAGR